MPINNLSARVPGGRSRSGRSHESCVGRGGAHALIRPAAANARVEDACILAGRGWKQGVSRSLTSWGDLVGFIWCLNYLFPLALPGSALCLSFSTRTVLTVWPAWSSRWIAALSKPWRIITSVEGPSHEAGQVQRGSGNSGQQWCSLSDNKDRARCYSQATGTPLR